MFERFAKYHLLERHGICSYKPQDGPFASSKNYDTTEERRAVPLTTYEQKTMTEMIVCFFSNGKPIYTHLGMAVDQFIIWAVTRGKYRSDSKKRVWVHQGTHRDVIKFKHGDGALWLKMTENDGFHIIKAITKNCNLLYEEVLQRLTRYDSNTSGHNCRLENLRNLPEFVQFQSHRKMQHKECKWHYQPRPQGGNKADFPAAKSIRHRKHSVHRALLKYHFWLEPLKNK
jgi:hypothetical protein